MRRVWRWWLWFAATMLLRWPAHGQDLEPRAYSVSPRGVNFVVLGVTRSTGDVAFDPTLPVQDGGATLYAGSLGYGRAISFWGRSASLAVLLPYVRGAVQGLVNSEFRAATRSGLADPVFRFAVNVHGAPAMNVEEFRDYRQKTNVGVSVAVVAPLGQYDPGRLLNIGSNRWAAKPEVGLSRRIGRWYLDCYLGGWFFSENRAFRAGPRTQAPIGSGQFHAIYAFTRTVWASFDANYYTGGRTTVGGVRNLDLQRNSRVGGTVSIPLARHQSLKLTGSTGAKTTVGAAFNSIGLAYQFVWARGL